MELLEFVVDQFVWILLVLSPHQLPGSLHPQQIMKQYSINSLYNPTNT